MLPKVLSMLPAFLAYFAVAAALITVFLLLTSPVTTMLLMRAAVFRSESGRDRQGETP